MAKQRKTTPLMSELARRDGALCAAFVNTASDKRKSLETYADLVAWGLRADEDCDLLFVDRTAGSPRKWCSMEACGRRVKARKHYLTELQSTIQHEPTPLERGFDRAVCCELVLVDEVLVAVDMGLAGFLLAAKKSIGAGDFFVFRGR